MNNNIGDWENTEGYYIKVSNEAILSISNSEIISLPLTIPLNAGWNIISYPAQELNDIEIVLAELIINQNLYCAIIQPTKIYTSNIFTTPAGIPIVFYFRIKYLLPQWSC